MASYTIPQTIYYQLNLTHGKLLRFKRYFIRSFISMEIYYYFLCVYDTILKSKIFRRFRSQEARGKVKTADSGHKIHCAGFF